MVICTTLVNYFEKIMAQSFPVFFLFMIHESSQCAEIHAFDLDDLLSLCIA